MTPAELQAIWERAEKYFSDLDHSGGHITGCPALKGRECACGYYAARGLPDFLASESARADAAERERDEAKEKAFEAGKAARDAVGNELDERSKVDHLNAVAGETYYALKAVVEAEPPTICGTAAKLNALAKAHAVLAKGERFGHSVLGSYDETLIKISEQMQIVRQRLIAERDRLQAENERLRAALFLLWHSGHECDSYPNPKSWEHDRCEACGEANPYRAKS